MADTPPRRWPALDLRRSRAAPETPVVEGLDERLALALDGLGATAVEQPGDDHARVYFADEASRRSAAAELETALGHTWVITLVDVPDEGWLDKVQSTLRAVSVGRFVIAPPWDVPDVRPDSRAPVLIVIEPSMGFGTGHHESTRLCLRALEGLDVRGTRVLDVGTGSGVLAIAAAKLSAPSVLAVDTDPDAVASARDNAARNGVAATVDVRHADVAAADVGAADIVLANLTAGALSRCASKLSAAVGAGGALVTSGFTADQEASVVAAFPDLVVVDRLDEQGWACVVFRRPTGTLAGPA